MQKLKSHIPKMIVNRDNPHKRVLYVDVNALTDRNINFYICKVRVSMTLNVLKLKYAHKKNLYNDLSVF